MRELFQIGDDSIFAHRYKANEPSHVEDHNVHRRLQVCLN